MSATNGETIKNAEQGAAAPIAKLIGRILRLARLPKFQSGRNDDADRVSERLRRDAGLSDGERERRKALCAPLIR